MIDVEHESSLHRQRSLELAAMLHEAVVVVDRSGIAAAEAESRRLKAAADVARAEVAARLKRGEPAGVGLGPVGAIRWVPSSPNPLVADPDPDLRGRTVLSTELFDWLRHRRDVVSAAYRQAYLAAAEAYERRPPLVAAAKGHLALLRQRQSFGDEGGQDLAAALQRFENSAQTLRAGQQQADEIEAQANATLENLRGLPTLAAIERDEGPMAALHASQWVNGRWSAALGSVPVDATTGQPIPIEEPAGSRK